MLHWLRKVMNETTWSLITSLPVHQMDALEISGKRWQTAGFRSYECAFSNTLDIDKSPLDRTFDIVLAEQVWEHLKYPYRAGSHVLSMLKPGGYFCLTTPFLVRRHDDPIDCTRWTAVGLNYYLEEVGFDSKTIYTGSWGNLGAVIANLTQWTEYDSSHNAAHSLQNDPMFPIVVWGLAQKKMIEAEEGGLS